MDYRTYQKLRGYCWQDLSPYIDTPFNNDTLELKQFTGEKSANIGHEHAIAMGLYQTTDLTPREQAAAHLLAVISNHRAIAWHREPVTPGGRPPAAPLEPWQVAELGQQTINAISEYAAFVPEREAVALLALLPDPVPEQDAVTPAPAEHAIETKEQRQDRRLKACIDAGLAMDDRPALVRLPYGVGVIAEHEGVTRQAFSTDVKAALVRRASAKREGVTVHRA